MTRALAFFLAALLVPLSAQAITLRGQGVPLEIRSDRVARLEGDIMKATIDRFEAEMLSTIKIQGDRIVLIDSLGGRMDQGQKAIELLRLEKAQGIRIVCVALRNASSMAFNLLTYCDVRLALPRAVFIFHRLAFEIQRRSDERLTAPVLKRMATELDKDDEPYRRGNAKALGLELAEYDLHADQETVWLAETLVKRGYLRALVTITP
jgi:ATP-dependent protease ClpP protease subunit